MIYVVTAVHNRYSITEKFVSQLLEQSYDNIFLLLVDDGSTDGTAEMVKEKMENCHIIFGDGDLWWGGALHKAYLWFKNHPVEKDDYILISNDDVEFGREYIKHGIEILSHYSKTLLTGYGIGMQSNIHIDGAIMHSFPNQSKKKLLDGEIAIGNCTSTRSLFCRVGDFLEIGGFHPFLLRHYGSDYEWTIRAYKKGFKILCDKRLSYYVNEMTTGNKKISIKKLFSIKSQYNPLTKIVNAFMCAPFGKKTISVLWVITPFRQRGKKP